MFLYRFLSIGNGNRYLSMIDIDYYRLSVYRLTTPGSYVLGVLDGLETDHRLVGKLYLGSPGKDDIVRYRRVPRSMYSLAHILD